MKKIPIILATDKNLIPQMYVTILSALKTKDKNSFYEFYCLLQDKLTPWQKKIFTKLEKKYQNTTINFIKMKNEFADTIVNYPHITVPTYYRLLLAERFPQFDKILYLDVDICVKQDLTALYETNLGDNYVAGVHSALMLLEEQETIERLKSFGIKSPDLKTYINAGVTLLNLEQIRKDNKTKELLEFSKQPLKNNDEDIINIVFNGKIKLLDFKYNVQPYLLEQEENQEIFKTAYGKENYEQGIKNPVIIHYITGRKPWNTPNVPFAKDWWKIAIKCPFNIKAPTNIQKKLISQIKATKGKKVVFWGASLFLQDSLKHIKGFKNIIGIIDGNKSKQGNKLYGYHIYSPDKLPQIKPDIVIFTIAHNNVYTQIETVLNNSYSSAKLLPNIFERN